VDAVADEGAEARGRAAHGVANELHRTLLVSGDGSDRSAADFPIICRSACNGPSR
jgi:hypothetical protein